MQKRKGEPAWLRRNRLESEGAGTQGIVSGGGEKGSYATGGENAEGG